MRAILILGRVAQRRDEGDCFRGAGELVLGLRRVIADWLDRYHSERPLSALGYLTPKEFSEGIAA